MTVIGDFYSRTRLYLLLQCVSFGLVGILATATHATAFLTLIEFANLPPLGANFGAFSIAILVSFFGHFHWTFRQQTSRSQSWATQRMALLRFVMVALTGLMLNSLAVFLVIDVFGWPYQVALLFMVGVVPGVIFALSKFWAFSPIVPQSRPE